MLQNMVDEPQIATSSSGDRAGRWRWWYSAIADWMIANPGGTFIECGKAIGRHHNTIGQIYQTDMFQEYYRRRKEEHQRESHRVIRSKLQGVAEATLDIVLEELQKKKAQIPMQRLESLMTGTLDRLGYAPAASPTVVVNNSPDNRQQTVVVPSLTPQALEEARFALRQAEQLRAGSSFQALPATAVDALEGPGAEPDLIEAEVNVSEGGSLASTSDEV